MGKAGDDDMGVVVHTDVSVQCTPAQDVVARQRDQHRMLDIVVKRVAVADAFEREAGRRRHDLHQRLRRPEPAAHEGPEKVLQGVDCQFR